MKICREIPNLVKIRQKYLTLHMKSHVSFISAGDIKWPEKRSLRLKWCRGVLPSACLASFISAAPTGRISMKFSIGEFHENVEKFQIWLKSVKNI